MRILVFCPIPESAAQAPDSAFAILEDLGCRVDAQRLDCRDIDTTSAVNVPSMIVLDAGDDIGQANQCRRILSAHPIFAEIPTLLVLSMRRLAALDFSLGFEDFLLSPIVPAELYSRLRQMDWRTAEFGSEERIKSGDLLIDLPGREVQLAGRTLEFTHQEFELLRFLAQNRGRVYSRAQLLQQVWDYQYAGGTRTVDIHVRRIRAKLGNTGTMIVTVRNVGYKMTE